MIFWQKNRVFIVNLEAQNRNFIYRKQFLTSLSTVKIIKNRIRLLSICQLLNNQLSICQLLSNQKDAELKNFSPKEVESFVINFFVKRGHLSKRG